MSHDGINHERFEQLCALAAIGEVSADEFAELNEHLSACSHCRETSADFRRITSRELGALATERWSGESIPEVDEGALLTRLLERAHAEASPLPAQADPVPALRRSRLRFRLWNLPLRPIFAVAGVLVLVCAASIAAYRLRDQQLAPTVAQLNSELARREKETRQTGSAADSISAQLRQNELERESLQRALEAARNQYAEALNRQRSLERDLAAAQEKLQTQGGQLLAANEELQKAHSSEKDLQGQLHEAALHTRTQESLLDQLQRKLRQSEEESQSVAASGIQEGDGREVFGARDLHIVDVYDVDATGRSKRTFGRVYFVEKKLLLFYAFDLQDKQHQRVASAFQAWGYRQDNEGKPQNLGLFLMDDPNVGRWVLKVNNASVLQRIDAVFVTIEPPDGSPSPKGRKLLYANLGGPPNHP